MIAGFGGVCIQTIGKLDERDRALRDGIRRGWRSILRGQGNGDDGEEDGQVCGLNRHRGILGEESYGFGWRDGRNRCLRSGKERRGSSPRGAVRPLRGHPLAVQVSASLLRSWQEVFPRRASYLRRDSCPLAWPG